MNTSAVAKLLAVSPSTIQRWVKQANLQMERTELGHYQFSDESIEILRDIKDQLNNGVLLQDLKIKGRQPRKATIKGGATEVALGPLVRRMDEFDQRLERKADEVVAYQILQHRREIDELQSEIALLKNLIVSMQESAAERENEAAEAKTELSTSISTLRKFKKKNFISSFFGF
ncbi:MerR family transcriptional regulator [Bacillus sp. ISL-35]|uniref:MerR family transcriptional regulator n=1 Tax=Bacillus sp. ISL-35 TaxID=2819122 RepID=UPI001BEBB39B|nr:MerR family transcriptional regulator [Bacillus sp. ISL-35]MBT2680996.1 MerR family transcriptional regulator [Bacillus sp. ISL-35]MBT2705315.1 MerR family transcriptional regulator [Chryseobacterium sp. ISL-80]